MSDDIEVTQEMENAGAEALEDFMIDPPKMTYGEAVAAIYRAMHAARKKKVEDAAKAVEAAKAKVQTLALRNAYGLTPEEAQKAGAEYRLSILELAFARQALRKANETARKKPDYSAAADQFWHYVPADRPMTKADIMTALSMIL